MKVATPGSLGRELTEEEALREYKNLFSSSLQITDKKIRKARIHAGEAAFAHCRFRLRNPEVRAELQQLQTLCREELAKEDPDEYALRERIRKVTSKWKLPEFTPDMLLNLPPTDSPECTKRLDRILWVYAERDGIHMIESPVQVFTHPSQDYIDLRITDCDRPISELLPLIEDEIKLWKENKENLESRKLPIQRRRRIDNLDFLFDVFDRASDLDMAFPSIAAELKRPVPSVKSAYLVACSRILGETVRKKAAPLINFDPPRHISNCRVCKRATWPNQFCAKALTYTYQGSRKSSRERLGYDTTSDTVPQPKSIDGNRWVKKIKPMS